jgi:GT2 family glycosyltransferase
MISFVTPFSFDKNLGQAYNDEMDRLRSDDDWAVLMDTDIMFLDNKAPFHFKKAIELYPEAGLFTCYASRTGKPEQRLINVNAQSSDIVYHRKLAIKQAEVFSLKEIKVPIAGYCFAVQKKTWKQIGGFKTTGILSVDTDFSSRILAAGKRIYLIESVYCLHYYRLAEGGASYKDHLR